MRFKQDHPYCCFCRGVRPTETEDHVPSRAMFNKRQWPEGYVFPACNRCNSSTKLDEQIVALLSRAYPDSVSEVERREFVGQARGLLSSFPELVDELKPTDDQERAATNGSGFPSGTIQFLNADGPYVQRAIQRFGLKLASALYYKHCGRVLPVEAGVVVFFFSNFKIVSEGFPDELLNMVPASSRVERNAQSLDGQFVCRFGYAEDGSAAVFLAQFRQSFAVGLVVHRDGSVLKIPDGATMLSPGWT